jgi:hypothetical protein
MTDERYLELRRRYREHDSLDSELLDALRAVATQFVRFGGLPRSYAPYGVWDDEAVEEILARWIEKRLIGLGHLHLLLNEGGSVASFKRLAERSLRQYLLNERARSQSQNLYWRVKEMLEKDPDFTLARDASRAQDRWWSLTEGPTATFADDDRSVLAHAWALGDFTVIRYGLDAKKLAPVLDQGELKRFVAGLLGELGEALSLRMLTRALSERFGLDEVQLEALAENEPPAVDVELAPIVLSEVAFAAIAEMTSRQAEVLIGSAESETMEAMARRLQCSQGTIVNEQRRVGAIISRFAEDEDERNKLLSIVVDLLYEREQGDT